MVLSHWLAANSAPLGERLGQPMGAPTPIPGSDGQTLCYVARLQPEGFVVVSADDSVEPIIAFSSKGHFQADPLNPLLGLLSRDLPRRIVEGGRAIRAGALAGSSPRPKWRLLEQSAPGRSPKGKGVDTLDSVRVAPFVQSQWGQLTIPGGSGAGVACYNYYTPPYEAGASSNYPCGCNPTAWGQIMRYYRYPSQPVGTNSYSIHVDGMSATYALRGGDGRGGPYDWEQMPLVPGPGTTQAQRQAIGALMADLGAASRTSYSAGSSSGTLQREELTNTFHYGNMVATLGMGSDFVHEVLPDLEAKVPVCLTTGEHEFVCDGYGYDFGTLYNHLNLGWDGLADAWYNLPEVDTGLFQFTSIVSVFYNIFTNGTGEVVSGRVLDTNGVGIAGATVTGQWAGGGSRTAVSDALGYYGLVAVPSDTELALSAVKADYGVGAGQCVTGKSLNATGPCGNVWGADLTLVPPHTPPLIVTEPTNSPVALGQNISFVIAVEGNPLPGFQWQRQPRGAAQWTTLNDGGSWSGCQTARLTVSGANDAVDGDRYRCVASNVWGFTFSAPARLNIIPVFTTNPANQQVLPGRSASFTVATEGYEPPSYQWQREAAGTLVWTNLQDSAVYLGSRTPSLEVTRGTPEMDGDGFRCIVANESLSATSAPAILVTVPYTVVAKLLNIGFPEAITLDHSHILYVTAMSAIVRVSADGQAALWAGNEVWPGTNDGPVAEARFSSQQGLATDASGTVYVADTLNYTIRKITPDGMVSTLAGAPRVQGYVDGVGAQARFVSPAWMAVDAAGNAYVADLGGAVREVTPGGAVTTWCKINGLVPGPIAVGKSGDVYVAYETLRDRGQSVWRITPDGQTNLLAGSTAELGQVDGLGTEARFQAIKGIATDAAENVYVLDSRLLRRITPLGLVTTIAGGAPAPGGSTPDGIGENAGLDPIAIASDDEGILYVADLYVADQGWQGCICVCAPVAAPQILKQPEEVVAAQGWPASFQVETSGNPPPAYQWFKDGVPILGATNAALTLNNVQASDAADYSVAVSNVVSMVTSQRASLTLAPLALSVERTGDALRILIRGDPTTRCRIQRSADLESWTDIGSFVTDSAGNAEFDVDLTAVSRAGFYRAVGE